MATRFAASPSILNFMASSPNYGKLASVGAMENAKTEAQNLVSNAGIHMAGITGKANVKKAKYAGEAMAAQGEAAGRSAMMGGIASGIGSIAGGFMNMPSGDGTVSGYGMNSFGNYTNEFSKAPDMTGFTTPFAGTKFSGFPTTGGFA